MKIKIVFFVFLLFLANFLFGQVKFRVKKLNADSLVALLPEKEGTDKIEALNLLSNVICRKDIDSSINLATQAIDLSEKLEYQKGLADGYFNVGNGYFLLDSLQPTISNYLKALRIYEDLEPSEEYGNLCMQLYLINLFTRRLESSFQYGKRAISIYNKINDTAGMAMANFGCIIGGYIYEWDTAIYYCNTATSLFDPKTDQNEIAYVYNALGETYQNKYFESHDTSYLTTALFWIFKALDQPKIYDEVKTMIYFNVGNSYLMYNTDEDIHTAIEYLQLANYLSDSCFDAYDWKSMIYYLLGWASYSLGDNNKAIFFYKEGIKTIEHRLPDFSIIDYKEPVLGLNFKRHHKRYKQLICTGLYNTYYELGNYKKALEYYKLSKEAEQNTYHEKYQNMFTMQEYISEDEKTEKQIQLLTSDNALKEVRIKQSRTMVFAIGGIFIILLMLGLLFLRQNKLKNEHHNVVLGQKLLRSQMNPHFIFNSLANIQEFIWNKDPLTANEYLSSFSKLVRLILENSRNDFVSVENEISTLENYLNLQKLRYRDKLEYTIYVDPKIDEENMLIPPMLVQPFIENSIEHGISQKETTGHVDVRFFIENDKINIEVKDDGIGFKKSSELKKNKITDHQSLAMTITRERLLMHYKKYKRKIELSISDLTDERNQVKGALVMFGIPYNQI